MFFFLSWWLVKVESWWITWPWTSIRGFKSLAMTLFFARCRYWNWHQNRSTQTKLRVKSSKLIIDKAVPKTNSAISFFFQENITFHWHFPETLWFRLALLHDRDPAVICYYISQCLKITQKSLIFQHWFDGDCPSYQWPKIMMDEFHFCLMDIVHQINGQR